MEVIYTKVPSSCSHLALQRTGDFSGIMDELHADEFLNNPPTPAEKKAAERVLLREYCNGKTKAQLNADFVAGVRMTMVKVV